MSLHNQGGSCSCGGTVSAGYARLSREGELVARAAALRALQSPCVLCPRRCRADRARGERGYCRVSAELLVSSGAPHFGEEAPLVGESGSGTIFLTGCNLGCLFCQNFPISHLLHGETRSAADLAGIMVGLAALGCHNINIVTPTHYAPQLVEALDLAAARGLDLPLVYNCGGYESLDALQALDGVVDIYMPDVKFFDGQDGERFCAAPDYPEVVRSALLEMQRQVGDLTVDSEGRATTGLLIRHLVMPGRVEDSRAVIDFIAQAVSRRAYVNVMRQYRPCYRAAEFPDIARPVHEEEYQEVREHALARGLRVAA